jgi:hypothetical protein
VEVPQDHTKHRFFRESLVLALVVAGAVAVAAAFVSAAPFELLRWVTGLCVSAVARLIAASACV